MTSQLAAAVPGIPEAGADGVFPHYSITVLDDLFANGLYNTDDLRSAGLAGQVQWRSWTLSAQGDLLTDRQGGFRSDDAVVLIGKSFGETQSQPGWQMVGFLGAGIHASGPFGGKEIQNGAHALIGEKTVSLPYEKQRVAHPTVGGSLEAGWIGDMPRHWQMTGRWATHIVAAAECTLQGRMITEIGPRLALIGQDGSAWIDVYRRGHFQDAPTRTASAVLNHEDGTWLRIGATIAPWLSNEDHIGWQISSGFNLETHDTNGSIGIIATPNALFSDRPSLAFVNELALYSGGGFGVQWRWQPDPSRNLWSESFVLDYAFGSEPDGTFSVPGPIHTRSDAYIQHDQITIGWEESLHSPVWSHWSIAAFAQAGAGVRSEDILIDQAGTRSHHAQAIAPVLRGASGFRVQWRDIADIGLSVDGWMPWWRQSAADSSGEAISLNDAGWALGLHAGLHMTW